MSKKERFMHASAVFVAALMLLAPLSLGICINGGEYENVTSENILGENSFTADYSGMTRISIDNVLIDGADLKDSNGVLDKDKNVITLNTPNDLVKFSNLVNGDDSNHDFLGYTVILTDNINLSETTLAPIGKDEDNSFKGIFDGQGYKISNLKLEGVMQYTGLFGYIGSGGVVKNVSVVGDITINAVANVTVNNTSKPYVEAGSNIYAGGIAGCNAGLVQNCDYSGEISVNSETNVTIHSGAAINDRIAILFISDAYAGGIVGWNHEGMIESCYNVGNVICSVDSNTINPNNIDDKIVFYYDSESYAGGIVGCNEAYDSGATAIIQYCYNTGDVTAVSGYDSIANAGGIVGFNRAYYNATTIQNCYNAGTVEATGTGEDSYAYAGGIVGYNMAYYYGAVTIQNCYNTGAVEATGTGEDSYAYAGGITGHYGAATIQNCYNTGAVEATATGEDSRASAGGIAGYNDASVIQNCYNTGAVEATATGEDSRASAGGIVGQNYACFSDDIAIIQHCYNIGIVKATASGNDSYANAGGIGGYVNADYDATIIIQYCYNINDVTAVSEYDSYANAGGIGGYVNADYDGAIMLIQNCYNTGDIIATATPSYAYAGGIAGQNYKDANAISAIISNCYNTGIVIATAINEVTIGAEVTDNIEITSYAYVGGIIGWNNGAIENCYNVGNVTANSIANIDVTSTAIIDASVTLATRPCAYVGEIAGENDGTIENCYNIGGVAATADADVTIDDSVTATYTEHPKVCAGGIAGSGKDGVNNCYRLTDITTFDSVNDTAANDDESGHGKINIGDLCAILNAWVNTSDRGTENYLHWINGDINGMTLPVFADWYGESKFLTQSNLEKNSDGYYKINNGYELALIAENLNGKYILVNDIDLSRYYWNPIGTNEKQFKGTFDGQGHTISNLSITSDAQYASLFGYIGSGGEVRNVGIVDSLITTTASEAYAGGIAGYNAGTIENCYNAGSVSIITSVENSEAYAGGIAGYNAGTIENCYNAGNVTIFASGENCAAYAGGIAGQKNENAKIESCYQLNGIATLVNGADGKGVNVKEFYFNGKFSDNMLLIDVLNNWVNDKNSKSNNYSHWVIGTVNSMPLPAFSNWYAEAKYIYDALSPNSNGVYEIKNGYELALMADDLDGHYILLNDIDLLRYSWLPVGNYESQFTGTFDGNGYKISNLNISGDIKHVGLFGYIGVGGVVKNVDLIDTSINANGFLSEVFVGSIAGTNNGMIENCSNNGDVTATASGSYSYAYAGGIVGYNYADDYDFEYEVMAIISNCYNTGDVTATASGSYSYAYAGGIVGHNYVEYNTYGATAIISNCYNTGDICASSNISTAYAGGIVGYNGADDDVSGDTGEYGATAIIQYCYNTGDVTAIASGEDYSACAGGIVGYNEVDDDAKSIISNCYNTGNVTATASGSYSYAYAGGIVGYNELDDDSAAAIISNCYNIGDMAATSYGEDSYAYAGGIVGHNEVDDDSATSIISNCYNTGNVIADAYYSARAGGIVGYNDADDNYATAIIQNCYNTGYVISTSFASDSYARAGGIAGYNEADDNYATAIIQHCFNTGYVIATAFDDASYTYAGGIVGYNYANENYATAIVQYCYNTGNVVATASTSDSYAHAGGIAGYNDADDDLNSVYEAKSIIQYCYNTGNVIADAYYSARAGGIVGYNYAGNDRVEAIIQYCYNTGGVIATTSDNGSYARAGGIAGYNGADEDYAKATIQNCYNIGNVTANVFGEESYARAGGITGHNNMDGYATAIIENCYNIGIIDADIKGGIAGYNDGTIRNAFYANDDGILGTNDGDVEGTIGLAKNEMIGSCLFGEEYNINSDGVWSSDLLGINNGFPILANVPLSLINLEFQSPVYILVGVEEEQVDNFLKLSYTGKSTISAVIMPELQGDFEIKYQWYMYDNESNTFKEIEGAVNDTYTLPNDKNFNKYFVKVTFSNESGESTYASFTRDVQLLEEGYYAVQFDADVVVQDSEGNVILPSCGTYVLQDGNYTYSAAGIAKNTFTVSSSDMFISVEKDSKILYYAIAAVIVILVLIAAFYFIRKK